MDDHQLLAKYQQLPDELLDPGGSMPAEDGMALVFRQRAWMETGEILTEDEAQQWYSEQRAVREAARPSATWSDGVR